MSYEPFPDQGSVQMPERSRPPAPPSIVNAARAMYAGAAASIIGIIIDLTTVGATKTAIEKRQPTMTAAQVSSAEHLVVGLFIASGLIGAALWVWMAQANKAGRSWARIVATVLFGIDTIGQLIGFSSGGGAARIFSLLVWLIGLIAVVFLWQRPSTAYFRESGGA